VILGVVTMMIACSKGRSYEGSKPKGDSIWSMFLRDEGSVVVDLGATGRLCDGPRAGQPAVKWALVPTIEIIY
jgi:hypothetical protein